MSCERRPGASSSLPILKPNHLLEENPMRSRILIPVLALLAILLTPLKASADSPSSLPVSTVQVLTNGTVIFQLGTGTTPLCSSNASGWSNTWASITVGSGGVTADGLKGMLSLLTSAKLAGRSVFVWANNGTSADIGCQVNHVALN
jgi:hypothetical protein